MRDGEAREEGPRDEGPRGESPGLVQERGGADRPRGPSRSPRDPRRVHRGLRICLRGIVQGVGFRPWVHRLALDEGLKGRVRNAAEGVIIEVFGEGAALERFLGRLRIEAPVASRIRHLESQPIPYEPLSGMRILPSASGGESFVSIPADLATCDACAAEIRDAQDRRHGYAFTNCTSCGPRFSIVAALPYDRQGTSMAGFELCEGCREEYEEVSDRRFHAQPNACPRCGPRLRLERGAASCASELASELASEPPLEAAAALLRAGKIVAIKGLGGFHLACDAGSPAAVATLRRRKHRGHKPFAVMVRDLDEAHGLAFISRREARLLGSSEAPIVLLRRRLDAPIAADVAPGMGSLGVLLPYTPLHHLLLEAVGRPLVMTSGNLADEPICIDGQEARARLLTLADAFLDHDRPIVSRCDDSVAICLMGAPTLLRRSRGYVPRAIPLRSAVPMPVLGCGAHSKNTFCIAVGSMAYLGPHIGTLETLESLEAFEEAVAHMERLLGVRPERVAHDMHPGYGSTRYALSRAGADAFAVQHHHAHIVSAMAEHGLEGPVLGVAYDGSGWGPDGTAWGAEILLAERASYRRLATFRPLALAGHERAIQQPWRLALAALEDAFDGSPPPAALALLGDVPEPSLRAVRQMLHAGLCTSWARGLGRVFDALGALALGRHIAHFEGEVAMAWGEIADPEERGRYPVQLGASAEFTGVDLRPLLRRVVRDLLAGVSPALISARFHNTIVSTTAALVVTAMEEHGRLPIVLTGGCFINRLLTERLAERLAGFEVHLHQEVPPGDGGIALGQALVAAAAPAPGGRGGGLMRCV